MFAPLARLPRTVWLLGLISLLNDTASDLVYPLIPLYLSSVLMAGPRALGVIEGIAEATASLLKLWAGVWADRSRHIRPWLVWGYGLGAFGRPLIALVTSWPGLLAIRFADRIGKGLRTSPRDAMLADSVAPDQRGLAFGLHRAMDNAGAVIGPLLASLLLALGVDLRHVFFWTVVPAIACLLLTLLVPTPPHHGPHARAVPRGRLSELPRPLRQYLVIVALFTLGNSSNMFLLLRARELGTPQDQIPLLWAAVSAVATVFSTPLASLSDRVGRTRLLLTGYLAYATYYAIMGLTSPTGALLYACFGFYGLFLAATEGVEKALVADLAPEGTRGSAFGWFNMTAGAMLLPASIVFGWLYQTWSSSMAFGFSAACAMGAAMGLLWWRRRYSR